MAKIFLSVSVIRTGRMQVGYSILAKIIKMTVFQSKFSEYTFFSNTMLDTIFCTQM